MTASDPPPGTIDFRSLIDLGPVRQRRLIAVRHWLGSLAGEGASEAALLAMWKFALERPQIFHERGVAIAVLDTLQSYAKHDAGRLARILEALKPRIATALDSLEAVNSEEDDGRFPAGSDAAVSQLVDRVFVPRHLRLLEYVFDPLTLPILAFHCETRRRKPRSLDDVVNDKTGNRLPNLLLQTPVGDLAKHWRPVIRNAAAHGGVSHTVTGLRFQDDWGNSEEHTCRQFIRHADRLQDACNGIALGYTAFLLQQEQPPAEHWPIPLAVAREALRGLLDQQDFRLTQTVPQPRADGSTLLNLLFDHRLVAQRAIVFKAYRAAFTALDLLPEFDFFGIKLHSPEAFLSFVILARDDLRAYDSGEIDRGELHRRCQRRGQLISEPRLRFAVLRHKWRLFREIAKGKWVERAERERADQWSEQRARFELITVTDYSTDRSKQRRAAAALDALPGKSKQLAFPDLAEALVDAVAAAKVDLPPSAPKAARSRRRCDRIWVTVFTRRIRPRDTDRGGFADPYLFTVEHSATGEFQKVRLVDHEVHEFKTYRVSIKRTSS